MGIWGVKVYHSPSVHAAQDASIGAGGVEGSTRHAAQSVSMPLMEVSASAAFKSRV